MAKQESRNGYVKRFNIEKNHKDFGKTANYNPEIQEEPGKRMGNDSFANMPDAPMIRKFSRTHNYRSGIINDFTCGLEKESGIEENKRATHDYD